MADGIVSTPAADVLVSAAMAPSGQSERKQARRENWRLIRRRPSFIIGNVIALFWVVCAILGDSITPHHPLDFRAKAHLAPSADYWFGTDKTGRDVFSRVLAGARDVLKIAPLAALLGVLFGVILGLLMGYIGKRLDNVLSRIIEAFLALPVVLIALLAITTLGNSSWVVLAVVSTLFTPIVARTVRSAVMAERDLDYVTSAKLRGESKLFIMFREILPNVTGPIVVELAQSFGPVPDTSVTLGVPRPGGVVVPGPLGEVRPPPTSVPTPTAATARPTTTVPVTSTGAVPSSSVLGATTTTAVATTTTAVATTTTATGSGSPAVTTTAPEGDRKSTRLNSSH